MAASRTRGPRRLGYKCAVRRLALTFAFVTLALALAAAALATRPADLILIATLAAFPAVGGLLSHRHPLAWLLIAEGFAWQLGIFCDGWVHHGGPDAAAWVLDWIWMPAVALIPVLLLLFPDGRPPSRRWWLVVVLLPALPLAFAGALASLGVRYRRASALERRQFAWIAYAGGVIGAGFVTATVLDAIGAPESVSSLFNVAPLAALPIAIGVAISRHRLYDLESIAKYSAAFAAVVYLAATTAFGGWRALLPTLLVVLVPLVRARRRRAPAPAGVVITTLGRFAVTRDGEPIAWPSKKARTLLKLLVARRGQPVSREALMESLWPGEDPRKLANRLSVALTALRTAIGAEAIVARDGAVALDLAQVSVDVERFLAAPDERAYTGDFLAEDRYEDWASDLREQAREAYASAVRERARVTKKDDEAVRAYLQLLEHDPYDATAHAELIARLDGSGRHGEAIRRRRGYIRAMREIGVHAAL